MVFIDFRLAAREYYALQNFTNYYLVLVTEAKIVCCKKLANFKGNVQERTVRKTDGWEMSKAFLVASYLQFSF